MEGQGGIRVARLEATMWNMVQTQWGVGARGKTDDPPRRKTRERRDDDALAPARGMLVATGLAAAIWAGIGLLVWWVVG
jgi:hypothetical protein